MTDMVPAPQFDQRAIETLRKTIAAGLNDQQFSLFLEYCSRTRLDPFAHQIHAYERGGRLIVQVGIDGLRLIAARTGELEGYEGPQWAGEDGVWKDLWLSDKPPAAARVGVYRRGFRTPVYGIAHFNEFAQRRDGKPTAMWQSMPANQLAKCAEAAALRKAFPAETSGLFISEEAGAMERVDQAIAERKQEVRVTVEQPAKPQPKQGGPVPRPQWVNETVEYIKQHGIPPAMLAELIGDKVTVRNLLVWGQQFKDPAAEIRAWVDRVIAAEQEEEPAQPEQLELDGELE